jgi:hypothetical protein
MFKFLFRKAKDEVEVVKETQRETISRAMGEVNDILAVMHPKPKVSVNLESGLIELDLPEQMPDEALALPAPEKPAEVEDAPETASDTSPDTASDTGPEPAKDTDTKGDAAKTAA